ncbi:MAG: AAA family ATPase [Alistipes sp.]|nr:AAA family ATPase [Candidatus Alistipes equi]
MGKCISCGKMNRKEALFCRYCGIPIQKPSRYGDLFGKKNIEEELDKFSSRASLSTKLKDLAARGRIGMDAVIYGDTGTGKRFVAMALFKILLKEKYVTASLPTFVDASDFNEWMKNLDANLQSVKDGVLIITNAQKLVPGEFASTVGVLDRIFARMKSSPSTMPVVFLCGLKQGLEHFLECNPDIAALFEFRFRLNAMEQKQITTLTINKLSEDFRLGIETDAATRLEKRVEWILREDEPVAKNGHLCSLLAQEAAVAALSAGRKKILSQDIQGKIFEPRTEEEIWRELDGFIGMDSVKREIHAIIDAIKDASRDGSKMKVKDHYVFTGNPGTGKTTIARIFSDVLCSLGILPKGQFVELAGKDLIADVIGGSERNVQHAVDRAMGGVLFIDEAYGLNDGQFGQAAIDKLLPIVENKRGEFVCIIAGYSREMRDFMKANSGLESRFNKTIDFPDYNSEELAQIFETMAKKQGYVLDVETSQKLRIVTEKMYNSRSENFGNARDVRNMLQRAEERRRERLRTMTEDEIRKEGKRLTYLDIAGKEALSEISLKDVMLELDSLVGLEGVKRNIRSLAASVNREQKLAMAEGRTPSINVGHYLFLGNPGTGKTTVARLMGKMLCALKLIPRADVTEVLRDDLVAGYQGQTAQKTKKAVMDVMGGVLFIDEAYSLSSGMGDTFGQECINTLVPLLENYKGKFVCIAAGYTVEMQEFLDANSGMKSRFRNRIDFEDYNAEDMLKIFEMQSKSHGLIISSDAREAVAEKLRTMYENRSRDFANAREVRNLLDDIRNRMAIRLMDKEDASLQELKTIEVEDVI